MTHEPSGVKRIQSPWRLTPGNISKYAQRAELDGVEADLRLHAGVDEGCRRAEVGHLRVGGEAPEGREVGVARVAVEEERGPTERQDPEQVVPHHPARRRKPEEAVVRP